MRAILKATTLAGLSAIPCLSMAQSSVTLYGLIDAGVVYVSNLNGHSQWKMQSGTVASSRWGMRGVEDLGGGYAAIFQLENGFNVMNGVTGNAGREFGRYAYVGLRSDKLGLVTIGRNIDNIQDFVGGMTAEVQWSGVSAVHFGDADQLDTSFRINNAIKYTSPIIGGFKFGGMFGLSNQAAGSGGGFGNNKMFSLGAGYAFGPVTLGVAYAAYNRPGSATNPNGAVTGEYVQPLYVSPAGTGAGVEKQQVVTGGGSYVFGSATAAVIYSNVKLHYLDGTSLNQDNVEVNGKYQFTPSFFAGLAYVYSGYRYAGLNNVVQHPLYHQVAVGTWYLLSKTTDVSLVVVGQKAAGDAKVAALTNVGASSSDHQMVVVASMRKRF
ncbi:porin [Paraburkholderia sp. LEh10]|uniref:porin n=1 Tax=Paraburkholderia sp. LEh10 TaxID=2821353 RepID=UPI001AE78506|nr:porin [Paraburkholderia sp. LEh10]MBP0590456.1 porin [Paraburkholderia sp. LEh10]